MEHPGSPESVDVVGRVRIIVRARWVGVAFSTAQVFLYALPYPPGIMEAALVIVASLAVSNIAFEVALRRPDVEERARTLALVMLVVDVLALSGITWVFSFDTTSALFAILFLLPIEGAVVFALRGAMWTWGAVGVLYIGREWFATRFDNPFELDSITFRVGLIGIVALIVGTLVRDLLEQRRVTAAALVEAERSEASLTAIIRVLAHDVRAPIAATRTSIDVVRSAGDRISDAERDRLLEAGRRQADRALLLARDLLDLARAEAGTLAVQPEDVTIADAVEAVAMALPDAQALEVDVGDVVVRADPVRLEQVLFNLLTNATKYGRPPIQVSARELDDAIELEVRDHGVGVPEGIELFAPFSRAGEGSVGLGMWIVRHLAQAMDGTVRHEDAEPGARFVLTLPAP